MGGGGIPTLSTSVILYCSQKVIKVEVNLKFWMVYPSFSTLERWLASWDLQDVARQLSLIYSLDEGRLALLRYVMISVYDCVHVATGDIKLIVTIGVK